jgi:hypothetical protein
VELAAVTAGRMVWFPGTALMAGRHGPGGSDGSGGSRDGSGVVLTAKEERVGMVSGHCGECGGVASAVSNMEREILAA